MNKRRERENETKHVWDIAHLFVMYKSTSSTIDFNDEFAEIMNKRRDTSLQKLFNP
jgi:hypothetical protein